MGNQALSRETSYVSSLASSMSLAMEEFYSNLRSVGVSAVSGQGCADFERALQEAADEFHSSYVPLLMEQRREIEEKRQRQVDEQIRDFERGLDRAAAKKRNRASAAGAEMDDAGDDTLEGLDAE